MSKTRNGMVLGAVMAATALGFSGSSVAQDATQEAVTKEGKMLSERLNNLAERVAEAEVRTADFVEEQRDARDAALDNLSASAEAARADLDAALETAGAEVSAVWASVVASAEATSEAVQEQISSTNEAMKLSTARSRAARLERHADLSIRHALLAIRDAELAVAAAIDAQLLVQELEGSQ